MSKFQEGEYNFDEELISEKLSVVSIPVMSAVTTPRATFEKNQKSKLSLNNYNYNILANKLYKYNEIPKKSAQKSRLLSNMQKQKENKQKKIKQLEVEVNNKMMAECTFKPQTNKSVNHSNRNLNEFLKSQQQHKKKIEQKKQTLKQNILASIAQSASFRPEINKKSQKVRNGPIYERLYNLKDKQKIVYENESQQKNLFKPQIQKKSKNLNRNIPVEDLLYQDALRRNEIIKQASITQKSQKNQSIGKNYKNDKFAAQKFIKEYYYVLEQLQIQKSQEAFSLQIFYEIFKRLGFLTFEQNFANLSSEQQCLLNDAFQLLEEYIVDARNTCVFLLGLLGIYYINPTNFERKENFSQSMDFNLDEMEGRKIQKYFQRFYRNRLSSQSLKKTTYTDENPYKPTINVGSEQLAQKYRQKMMQNTNQFLESNEFNFLVPQSGEITHTDLLVLQKLAKQIQIQKKREAKEKAIDPECTFQPNKMERQIKSSQVTDRLTPRSMANTVNLGVQKSNSLYNQAKQKNLMKNVDLTNKTQQLSHQQSHQKSTTTEPRRKSVKPFEKTHEKFKKNFNELPVYGKDIDKSIARMYEARKLREEKTKFFQRGYTIGKEDNKKKLENKKQQKKLKSSSKIQNQPILTIDINLGQTTQYIELYKQDCLRLNQIVNQFCEKHQLDNESKQKLLQMIDKQVQNVLTELD